MLTDAQWAELEPLVEACRPKGARGRADRAPGSAAHNHGHRLATPDRTQDQGQVARRAF